MFFLQFLFIISIEKGLEPNEARPVDSEITAQSIGPRSLPLQIKSFKSKLYDLYASNYSIGPLSQVSQIADT